jgi:hypothetical protein
MHVKETFTGENISDCSDGSVVTTIGCRISESIPKYSGSEGNGQSADKNFQAFMVRNDLLLV